MDGPSLDHSDSDSGESWTLLESYPAVAEEAPAFPDSHCISCTPEIIDKDEDTDGISIISDSEAESPSPYSNFNNEHVNEEIRPNEKDIPHFDILNTHHTTFNDTDESLRENDFLGDNIKHKIYVHKRNKRLSTVLNIIVLGSVITAAGVAIGHMWGAKHDCSFNTTPSVHKILSNLYKLQEENVYLRNKLKEFSSFYQNHQQKASRKPMKCMKVFEESLNNKSVKKITKCVDEKRNEFDNLNSHLVEPLFEKEFVEDVNKLQNIYQNNQSWLDEEITKRLKHEEKLVNNLKTPLITIDTKDSGSDSQKRNVKKTENLIDKANEIKRVSYADSLKSNQNKNVQKREITNVFENDTARLRRKHFKLKSENKILQSISDEELKKDDRYSIQKQREEKKKVNRQKSYKKQKRRNKYEQWEMKGGLMKDYDDLSIETQDNDVSRKASLTESGTQNEVVIENLDQANNSGKSRINENKNKKDLNWFEKRTAFRNEARKKLEQELFGQIVPNTAGWYFRRMQKREQCRTKNDNSTYRKLSKRDMNYKVKH